MVKPQRQARTPEGMNRIDPRVCVPLLATHLGCLMVPLCGVSSTALVVAAGSYALRAFGLSAGYHRLLAHGAFRCGRGVRLVLTFLGAAAAQLGPLWWVGHHRLHHRFADTPRDPHAPGVHGRAHAHMGWLLTRRFRETPSFAVPDLAPVPELAWLDRWPLAAPLAWALGLFALGEALATFAPTFRTNGVQLVAWGFFVSTVALYHVTFAVNSLAHATGPPRGAGRDHSRNVAWLALPTLGDAWHRNHHRFPASARHGLEPGQIDLCYALLSGMARLGFVRDLRLPPRAASSAAAAQAKPKRSPTRA